MDYTLSTFVILFWNYVYSEKYSGYNGTYISSVDNDTDCIELGLIIIIIKYTVLMNMMITMLLMMIIVY